MLVKIHAGEPITVQHGGVGYEMRPGVNGVPDDLAVRIERDGLGVIWRGERPDSVHLPQPDDIVAETERRAASQEGIGASYIFVVSEPLKSIGIDATLQVADVASLDLGPANPPAKKAPAKKGGKK